MQTPRFYRTKSLLPKGAQIIDTLSSAYTELFFIEHPHLSKSDFLSVPLLKSFLANSSQQGVWVYYPWLRTAVHLPEEEVYFRLRTARNRDLILEKEQLKYRDCVVGVAGLSVGSTVVATLVATGGPKSLKIADPDYVEITNLNRMRARVTDVGKNKAWVAAERAWELDPFASIEVWDTGIQPATLKSFLTARPKLNVFVDEMDDIALKVAARFACRAARIPVVMATDNGDSIIVDIERFDLEPKRPLFHGRVDLVLQKVSQLTRRQFIELSTKIIDPTYFTTRQQRSILAIGTRLSGVAQIGTAAALAGAAVSFIIRRIASGDRMPSGRYTMGCEPSLIPGYTNARQKNMRRAHTRTFLRTLSAPR